MHSRSYFNREAVICQPIFSKINEIFWRWGLTRIVTLPPLRQEDGRTAAHCTQCKGEIYEGEDYYRIDGRAVCTDCLARFAEDYFGACRITGGISQSYDIV